MGTETDEKVYTEANLEIIFGAQYAAYEAERQRILAGRQARKLLEREKLKAFAREWSIRGQGKSL